MLTQLFKRHHYLLSTLFIICVGQTVSAQTYKYQNPNLSAKERAIDLCSRLTLEEKAQLMLDESPAIPRLGIKKFFWCLTPPYYIRCSTSPALSSAPNTTTVCTT